MTDDAFNLPRLNMVEQQIRPWDVSNMSVLDLFSRLHREDFAPQKHQALAFSDLELPLVNGEKMMSPKMEARVVQALSLKPEDEVFELGSGSGFLTACLASLAHHVDSIEWHGELCAMASENLASAGIQNITLEQGDGSHGWPGNAKQYDAIALTASFPDYPKQFEAMLKPGGRMFVIVGEEPAMQARLVTRGDDGQIHQSVLFETCIDAAQGLTKSPDFQL